MTRGSQICSCINCGVQYKAFNSDVAAGRGKYCSPECCSLSRTVYVQVMAAAPGTTDGIANKAGLSVRHVRDVLRRLCQSGKMHAAMLIPAPPSASHNVAGHALVFDIGPSPFPDAPATPRAALSYFYEKAILAAMPAIQKTIIEVTGFPQSTVTVYVNELHARGACHIKGWKRPTKRLGKFVPVYEAGEGKDVPCRLKPLTGPERYQRAVKKLAASGKLEQATEHRKELRRARNLWAKGDPLVNAFFGR